MNTNKNRRSPRINKNRRVRRNIPTQTIRGDDSDEPQWSNDEKEEAEEQKKLQDRKKLFNQVQEALESLDDPKFKNFKLTNQFLGEGTVGSTFVSCSKMDGTKGGKQNCQYAAKIQRISGRGQKKMFEKEVSNHNEFGKLVPNVHTHGILKHKRQIFGIIVMDKLSMMLDDYLSKERDETELKKVADQVFGIFSELDRKKFTHGDTALFNIAFDSSGKIVLFDLDRASTNPEHFHKGLDFLRFRTELFKKTQSRGTKVTHRNNLQTLRDLTSKWNVPAFYKNDTKKLATAEELDSRWCTMFDKYAKIAKVRGREG